jgi:hypothetical protein
VVLEGDKKWAQGGWWMLLKVVGILSVIAAALGWCITEYREWMVPVRDKEDHGIHVQQSQ